MTTNKPLISVIMPVYNGGFTIRQAVESVFCHNIPLELLVIDERLCHLLFKYSKA